MTVQIIKWLEYGSLIESMDSKKQIIELLLLCDTILSDPLIILSTSNRSY